ncbi:MAG: hypothetical protein ABIP39_02375 [Polyangiaceae bacterium]
MSLRAPWELTAALIAGSRDVLEARAADGEAPAALGSRGWASFLLGLEDDALAAIEIHGHDAAWPNDVPPSLRTFVDRAREACVLPSFGRVSASPTRRGETPRKRAQIDAFSALILPLAAHAARVVDV